MSDKTAQAENVTGDQLLQYINRIERLNEEKNDISAAVREVFAEAKGNGFVPSVMRQLLRLRKMDPNDAEVEESMLDIYKRAIGMRRS